MNGWVSISWIFKSILTFRDEFHYKSYDFSCCDLRTPGHLASIFCLICMSSSIISNFNLIYLLVFSYLILTLLFSLYLIIKFTFLNGENYLYIHCSFSTSVHMHKLILSIEKDIKWYIFTGFAKYFIFTDVLECCPISYISLLLWSLHLISAGRGRVSEVVAKKNRLTTCNSLKWTVTLAVFMRAKKARWDTRALAFLI